MRWKDRSIGGKISAVSFMCILLIGTLIMIIGSCLNWLDVSISDNLGAPYDASLNLTDMITLNNQHDRQLFVKMDLIYASVIIGIVANALCFVLYVISLFVETKINNIVRFILVAIAAVFAIILTIYFITMPTTSVMEGIVKRKNIAIGFPLLWVSGVICVGLNSYNAAMPFFPGNYWGW